MPWPEVGYKFKRDSRGNSKGGDRKNSCKSDVSNGVVQQQITKGMEVDIPSDSRKCEEWRTAINRPGMGKDDESMVAILANVPLMEERRMYGKQYCRFQQYLYYVKRVLRNVSESKECWRINQSPLSLWKQEYHEANSSLSTIYDVQFACNVSGDGDVGASAQCNVNSRGKTVIGYAEADRLEFKGGGKVDTSY